MQFSINNTKYTISSYASSEYSQIDWIWNKGVYSNWYDFTLIELEWMYDKYSEKMKAKFHDIPDWRFEVHAALLGLHFTVEVNGIEDNKK